MQRKRSNQYVKQRGNNMQQRNSASSVAPPGSGCSVTFGSGLTTAAPGSAAAALVVADIRTAHDEVKRQGIDVSDMWHGAPFPVEARLAGPDPQRMSYGSFFAFGDPDGNAWLVQEVTTRRPGRI
jgi:hypothetical protein